MRNIVFLIAIASMFLIIKESNAATACTAKADNGSECSITCAEGNAYCVAGAKSVICQCITSQSPQKPKGEQTFIITPFSPGERDYFVNNLKPFILSLNSQRAIALANALDQVVNAVDQYNQELYNEAEWEYYEKRLELTVNERQTLDNWVEQNSFY